VVMEAYLHGVSTRKVDDLVRALGADTGISKSEVSRIDPAAPAGRPRRRAEGAVSDYLLPRQVAAGGCGRCGFAGQQRGHGSGSAAHPLVPAAPHPKDVEGHAVDTASRFVEALDAHTSATGDDPDLLPVRLAHVAAVVLRVDGVGLSIHGEPGLRTPLAASSEVAATAERLQFTAGSGPCLLAAESAFPVFATEDVLARRWPVFHDLLVTCTPLRRCSRCPCTGGWRAWARWTSISPIPTGRPPSTWSSGACSATSGARTPTATTEQPGPSTTRRQGSGHSLPSRLLVPGSLDGSLGTAAMGTVVAAEGAAAEAPRGQTVAGRLLVRLASGRQRIPAEGVLCLLRNQRGGNCADGAHSCIRSPPGPVTRASHTTSALPTSSAEIRSMPSGSSTWTRHRVRPLSLIRRPRQQLQEGQPL
jgi:hypothetical protein